MRSLNASLVRLSAAAASFGLLAVVGCQGPDEFYRLSSGNGGTTGAAGDPSGAGGSPAGVAGAGGGPVGTAGAGGGAAGTTGVAGTGAGGRGGAAASSGVAGTTGVAGTGPAGTTGSGGAAGGGAAGSGAAGAGAGGRGGGAGGAAGAAVGGRGGGAGGAAGAAGAAAGGRGGGAGGATGRIQVVAQCQDGASNNQIAIKFKIFQGMNEGTAKQWSDIKVRYHYSVMNNTSPVIVEFDHLENATWNAAKSSAMPMVTYTTTDNYVEFGFSMGAGTLQPFDNLAGSGEIQARIHPQDYHAGWASQTDDHSFMACTGSTYTPRMTMPGYFMGQLAWGTTP
jgi:hypothetical protein